MNKTHTDVEGMKQHYSTEGIPQDMVQSVSFMRQWLNEDRKCEPMVTARDLWHWLESGYNQSLQSQAEKYETEKREMVREIIEGVHSPIYKTRTKIIAKKYGVDLLE